MAGEVGEGIENALNQVVLTTERSGNKGFETNNF
jgi:hypothetical protein